MRQRPKTKRFYCILQRKNEYFVILNQQSAVGQGSTAELLYFRFLSIAERPPRVYRPKNVLLPLRSSKAGRRGRRPLPRRFLLLACSMPTDDSGGNGRCPHLSPGAGRFRLTKDAIYGILDTMTVIWQVRRVCHGHPVIDRGRPPHHGVPPETGEPHMVLPLFSLTKHTNGKESFPW